LKHGNMELNSLQLQKKLISSITLNIESSQALISWGFYALVQQDIGFGYYIYSIGVN
jgi:hypothetical protein